jgi:hypothetical protein
MLAVLLLIQVVLGRLYGHVLARCLRRLLAEIQRLL